MTYMLSILFSASKWSSWVLTHVKTAVGIIPDLLGVSGSSQSECPDSTEAKLKGCHQDCFRRIVQYTSCCCGLTMFDRCIMYAAWMWWIFMIYNSISTLHVNARAVCWCIWCISVAVRHFSRCIAFSTAAHTTVLICWPHGARSQLSFGGCSEPEVGCHWGKMCWRCWEMRYGLIWMWCRLMWRISTDAYMHRCMHMFAYCSIWYIIHMCIYNAYIE